MRKSAKNSILSPSAPMPEMAPLPEKTVLVGIDWADKEHAFSALLPGGKLKAGSFNQTKTGIDDWIQEIAKLAPSCIIDVCIETSSGALINALMEYSHVRIFPVNPLAMANYRKAFAPGGGKVIPSTLVLSCSFFNTIGTNYTSSFRTLQRPAN